MYIACYGSLKKSPCRMCCFKVTNRRTQTSAFLGLNVQRPIYIVMNCHKLLECHDTVKCCSCYLGPWVVEVGGAEGKDMIHLVTPQL